MITRTIYLKEPEKWFGTPEEEELIKYCIEWINNYKNFYFNFSPVSVDPINNINGINYKAKCWDNYYLILSKRVLEVFYGRCKKGNKRGKTKN